ncbi:MAG: hypothetical protein JST35_04875 [Armatimonadetes bacterium]|nr:hypothetical protein [Armatimonadota bacterium]
MHEYDDGVAVIDSAFHDWDRLTPDARANILGWASDIYRGNLAAVRHADFKAGALLFVSGLMLTFTTKSTMDAVAAKSPTGVVILLLIVSLFLLGSALASLLAFVPRMLVSSSAKSSWLTFRPAVNVDPSDDTLLYFGHVANIRSIDQLQRRAINSLDKERDIFDQLCDQLYKNARVARDKYRMVSFSVQLLMAAMAITVVGLSALTIRGLF